MKYTNDHGISLPMQVWLVHDEYDGYSADPFTISATSLLKSLRSVVLSARLDRSVLETDLMDLVASSSGTAFHDSIEKAWSHGNHIKNLKKLGYRDKQIERIRINPTKEELDADPDIIPFYMEERAFKKVGKWTISGKYDFIWDDTVTDFKSTSTYKWQKNASDRDYQMQGSIYKWLVPEKIKHNHINIEFIFTDFSKLKAITEASKNYPPHRLMQKRVTLLSVQETEQWIKDKLANFERYWDVVDDQLPDCTQEELWQDPPAYKYYKNPTAKRATRDFKGDKLAAYQRKADDGNVGVVKEISGKAKACNYCNARPICGQYKRLQAQNLV